MLSQKKIKNQMIDKGILSQTNVLIPISLQLMV